MDKNIAIYFEYDDGWMIVLYCNGKNVKYWNCDEHYWDDACEYINLLNKYEKVLKLHLKLKAHEDIDKYDIFDLTESDIEELKSISRER